MPKIYLFHFLKPLFASSGGFLLRKKRADALSRLNSLRLFLSLSMRPVRAAWAGILLLHARDVNAALLALKGMQGSTEFTTLTILFKTQPRSCNGSLLGLANTALNALIKLASLCQTQIRVSGTGP